MKPDVAVEASRALNKAHGLAIERLIAAAREPIPRTMLEAVAMKLESIAEADSGSAIRLPNSQIVGTYALQAGPGAQVRILEKEGRLIQHVEGFPDVALVFVKGNRYTPEGFPDGSITSFRVKDGKTDLLLEVPLGPPTIREKQ